MGYITIIRPINCAITFVSVLVGAFIAKEFTYSPQLILAGMIGFIVCAFGNIVNDLYDIEIDRINSPDRPLPSGKVEKKSAILLAIFLFIISILFSISFGLLVFLLVLGVLILLFTYALYFKKTIAGNFVVSIITGLSFILGGIVGNNSACIFPFLFSFFIHMPREIIKDVIDITGDKSVGIASLPILLGKERSFNISALFLGILCILLPLPYIMKILHLQYMIVVLIFAFPIIIYVIFRLLKKPHETVLTKLSNLLKISMAAGLIAMIL
ncbi:Protoheme IX farnesyltransferase [subsurface metagenome]